MKWTGKAVGARLGFATGLGPVGAIIGLVIGLLAGYVRWVDSVIMRIMDGMMGTGPVMMGGMGMGMGMAMPAPAGTSGLASAMSTFVDSAQNQSGVTPLMMQSLINRLNSSDGHLP